MTGGIHGPEGPWHVKARHNSATPFAWTPMTRQLRLLPLLFLAYACPAPAQDTASWLASQGLESRDVKTFEDVDIAIGRAKDGDEKVVVLRQGKPLWQSGPKDAEPGSRWTIQSVGRDLNGDGHPDAHITSYSGGANCCTTHHVVQLRPQARQVAVQQTGTVSGSTFVDIPGRKTPVMISADDSSANVFAPYATSYFPLVVLEVGPRGRMQLAKDLMQSKLPGQPPGICATPAPSSNAWLRERCNEYGTVRRQERVAQIKQRLEAVKATRSSDKARWQDYVDKGAAGLVAAELNRYSYAGHGAAGLRWLETIWPGNDPIKAQLVSNLQQTHARSAFAEDLKGLAAGR